MKKFLAIIMLVVAGVQAGQAQIAAGRTGANAKAEQELLKINREYDAALLKGDANALDAIYADEFIYTTPDSEVRTKAQQLAFTRSAEFKLETGVSSDVRMLFYGAVVVMTGQFTGSGTAKGSTSKVHFRERYTAVWVKRKSQWRLVAEQGNFIK